MRWNHPSPNMTGDGVWVEEPPCHPRVYRDELYAWTFYCPAHPAARRTYLWEEAVWAALAHVRSYATRVSRQ